MLWLELCALAFVWEIFRLTLKITTPLHSLLLTLYSTQFLLKVSLSTRWIYIVVHDISNNFKLDWHVCYGGRLAWSRHSLPMVYNRKSTDFYFNSLTLLSFESGLVARWLLYCIFSEKSLPSKNVGLQNYYLEIRFLHREEKVMRPERLKYYQNVMNLR